jgi:O-antigen biosynthesis protein
MTIEPDETKPEVANTSIIVPVYGQLPLVLKLCQSAKDNRQESIREFIVVDDASPEFDLRELVKPPFNVVRNPTNLGFCKTENVGAKIATGEYLLFLNSDIELHKIWLDPAVELMRSNHKIGVVGIKLVFPKDAKGEEGIQSCGGLYDSNRMPFHRYLGWKADDPRVNKTEKVSWVTGAAILTRRDLFEQVGGFDEEYGRGYFDDVDYCEKVKLIGKEIWYCSDASATHFVGQSMNGSMKTQEQQRAASKSFYQNARRFETKWSDSIVPDVQTVMVNF